MKLDSTGSFSTADETCCFEKKEDNKIQDSKHVSALGEKTSAAIVIYPKTKDCGWDVKKKSTSWCYLFVHNQKVKSFEALFRKDQRRYFIHRSIKYVPKGEHKKVKEMIALSVSGLIFLQGNPKEIQGYLDEKLVHYRLCRNCSTGKVAIIPNSQMEPFMRLSETDSDRIRFLLKPFQYYSQNRTLLRITSGDFAGLEGYVIRIARDRRLVMEVGSMCVAISGVHAERFEEVDKNAADQKERATFYKRNLHERNAFIDRYFHQVKSVQEVSAQAENIEILRIQTLADVQEGVLDTKDAYETFYFMVEEIGYYYAPFIGYFKDDLKPIFDAGKKVMQEIDHLISSLNPLGETRLRYEAEYEGLRTNYGYLFE